MKRAPAHFMGRSGQLLLSRQLHPWFASLGNSSGDASRSQTQPTCHSYAAGVTPTQHESSLSPPPSSTAHMWVLGQGFQWHCPAYPFPSRWPHVHLVVSHAEVFGNVSALLPCICPPSPSFFPSSLYSLCVEHILNTQACSTLFNLYGMLIIVIMIVMS